MRDLAIALVHFPILDRDAQIVTTAITNLDIHDIARSSFTYGLPSYYIVHPIAAQRELAERVKTHWTDGSGAVRIPDRKPPMQCVRIVDSLQTARISHSIDAEIWVTSAQASPNAVDHRTARSALRGEGPPVLLVFGTGWGLAPEVMETAGLRLLPITSPRPDGYNHLSVRAAAAILLDRLLCGGSE